MDIILDKLIKNYSKDKYPMSTGSEEWWDIKTDFENGKGVRYRFLILIKQIQK